VRTPAARNRSVTSSTRERLSAKTSAARHGTPGRGLRFGGEQLKQLLSVGGRAGPITRPPRPRASQTSILRVADCRGQAEPLEVMPGKTFDAPEQEEQVPAAVVAREGVQLVHDDHAHATEQTGVVDTR
jgi:hypothetical protein